MPHKSFREGSRKDYGVDSEDNGLTLKQLNTGALLRIADATEKMCLDREKLERDYQYMRDSRDRYRTQLDTERRRSAALRGVIARMKRAKR